jgi:hypothetical protein
VLLDAGIRAGIVNRQGIEQRVGIRLQPGDGLGTGRGRRRNGEGFGHLRPPGGGADLVQAGVGGDPVEPGADRSARLEPGQAPPRREQRVLHGVVGVLERAEHPVAVHVQLAAVRSGQLREGVLIARASAVQQSVIRHPFGPFLFRPGGGSGDSLAGEVSRERG